MKYTAVLIDDERLALTSLHKLLEQYVNIAVIGKHQNPYEAIEFIEHNIPDIVFLDIEMPGMLGMEVAVRLQDISPDIRIVFVTAYNHYAVDAFEVRALDYLLKPVRSERLKKTIERFVANKEMQAMATSKQTPSEDKQQTTLIRMFQSMQFELGKDDDGTTQLFHWRTQKSQELFAYLLQETGRWVRKDALIDILWPDYDEDRAYTNLYTTIYQLRKSLRDCHVSIEIKSEREGYRLENNHIEVDVAQWEAFMKQSLPINSETIQQHRRVIDLHRGMYLQEHDYEWAVPKQLYLNTQWFEQAVQVGDYYLKRQDYSELITLCYCVRERFPYAEYSYFTLMKIFAALDQDEEVSSQFQAYCDVLREEVDEDPKEHIVKWYEQWRLSKSRF